MSRTDTQPVAHTQPKRPRTVYLDPGVLDAALHTDRRHRTDRQHTPRVIAIDELAAGVRANVRDAARAVLTWLAAVTNHDAGVDLNAVLKRCLRPGGDVTRLNCAALAEEIHRFTGVKLSPKRVRTAIENLRHGSLADQPNPEDATPPLRNRLDALAARLRANHEALLAGSDRREMRRELGTDLLAAVRCAVGRVITHGFGEGIPDHVNLDELAGRYREYIRHEATRLIAFSADTGTRQVPSRRNGMRGVSCDLHRLLITLNDHDGTAEADMQLAMDGTRVVCDLLSPDSLPGVLARLNVLVAGRSLIDTPVYVQQMEALAAQAAALHEDAGTRSYLNWARRLPEDSRVPSPLRVASYCRNNATTRILERIHLGLLTDEAWLARAERNLAAMLTDDPGFTMLKVTQAIHATVATDLNDDATAADFFRMQGETKTIALLGDLMRYDNCPDLVNAVRHHAEAAWPGATHRYLSL